MSNGSGPGAGRDRDLKFFDKLPSGTKALLHGTPENMNGEEAWNLMRKWGFEGEELTAHLTELLPSIIATSCRRKYGASHPQCETATWSPLPRELSNRCLRGRKRYWR